MGVEELRRAISGCKLLALDTMVFSYHLSNHPRYAPLTSAVLKAIESNQIAGLITTVTLAEVLTAPAQAGDRRAMWEYELYLTHFPNLRIVPLDVALARETALVQAATGLRTPDAIQVAAAQLAGADAIVTNDRRWAGRVTEPTLVMLEEYAQAG
ncbi:MAG: type II toxin-antitoxin system VapC family toxin [Anaerolineae bacterium]|nr:type II toxin-antitoxin system VapC family toxin [Anaerolineae bacterium]